MNLWGQRFLLVLMVKTVTPIPIIGVKDMEGSLRVFDCLESSAGRDGLQVQVVL